MPNTTRPTPQPAANKTTHTAGAKKTWGFAHSILCAAPNARGECNCGVVRIEREHAAMRDLVERLSEARDGGPDLLDRLQEMIDEARVISAEVTR